MNETSGSNLCEQSASEAVDRLYSKDDHIKEIKQHRVDLDAVLQRIKSGMKNRERSLCITKVQEAIMWLGMELKEIGAPNPYPNSYNPGNIIVDKTADGLKL